MKNRFFSLVAVLLVIVFLFVSCESSDVDTEKERRESSESIALEEPETTNPPGYHSLNITMTTEEIYRTGPYSSFIPTKEAMETAKIINVRNYLLGEPEAQKPWTCLNTVWDTAETGAEMITVMHINCNYPYGGWNKTDITVDTFTLDVVKSAFEQNKNYVLVKQGEYVASYSISLAETPEELYALIKTAPCFNTAE